MAVWCDSSRYFFTEDVEIGDTLTARVNAPTLLSDWVVSNTNVTPASTKISYESNANTNEYSDAEQTKLSGIESGATTDQTDSEIETGYNNQVSTVSQAEAEAGTSTTVRRWTAERVSQAIAALSSISNPSWTNVTYSGSYADSSNGLHNGLRYRKDALGQLHIDGGFKIPGGGSSGDTIFILPADHRPASSNGRMDLLSSPESDLDNIVQITIIQSSGIVRWSDLGGGGAALGADNVYISITGIPLD